MAEASNMTRTVTPTEALSIAARGNRDMVTWAEIRDMAETIAQQADLIAAALALHADVHECEDGWHYPQDASCSTARALGVTA